VLGGERFAEATEHARAALEAPGAKLLADQQTPAAQTTDAHRVTVGTVLVNDSMPEF